MSVCQSKSNTTFILVKSQISKNISAYVYIFVSQRLLFFVVTHDNMHSNKGCIINHHISHSHIFWKFVQLRNGYLGCTIKFITLHLLHRMHKHTCPCLYLVITQELWKFQGSEKKIKVLKRGPMYSNSIFHTDVCIDD